MTKSVRVSLLAAALSACGYSQTVDRVDAAPAVTAVGADSVPIPYFADADVDPREDNWIGATLHAMHESPLKTVAMADSTVVWRFLYLRSFHTGISVRVVLTPVKCEVVTAELEQSTYTYGPPDTSGIQWVKGMTAGRVLRRDSLSTTPQSCAPIERLLSDRRNWKIRNYSSRRGLDGSDWMIERADRLSHSASMTFSAGKTQTPNIWNAGQLFLKLGNATPPANEIY